TDHPGRVAREVLHLESRDLVALLDGSLDLHRAAVPHLQEQGHAEAGERALELREVEVVRTAVSLGVRDLGRMTEDRRTERRRGPAMIGVAVAEDHGGESAEAGRHGRDLALHGADAGVETE